MQQSKAISTGIAASTTPAARLGIAAAMIGLMCGTVMLAQSASQADQAFVAKVSQGGLYEVEAGKVAAMRGMTPAVKDFGLLESHDHEGVNSELKHIAAMTSVTIKPGLNAEFTQRLDKLKAVPPAQFDSYYVTDMKQIHNNDEGLFAKEADEGSTPYKRFAHQTAVLVNAHLGWLNSL
jgi:putative membrane protein